MASCWGVVGSVCASALCVPVRPAATAMHSLVVLLRAVLLPRAEAGYAWHAGVALVAANPAASLAAAATKVSGFAPVTLCCCALKEALAKGCSLPGYILVYGCQWVSVCAHMCTHAPLPTWERKVASERLFTFLHSTQSAGRRVNADSTGCTEFRCTRRHSVSMHHDQQETSCACLPEGLRHVW